MQLLHGLCCFDFVLDIPLSPATLVFDSLKGLVEMYNLAGFIFCSLNLFKPHQAFYRVITALA